MENSHPTFDEYVTGFWDLYGHIDQERTLENMWLRLVESASSVGEEVREAKEEGQTYEDILNHLADVFCWTTNFITRCNEVGDPFFELHYEDGEGNIVVADSTWIIWEKYPGYCLTCESLGEVAEVEFEVGDFVVYPCRCRTHYPNIPKERKTRRAKDHAEANRDDRPTTIDGYVSMFKELYGQKYRDLSLDLITFHFLEEVGEVSEQIRRLSGLKKKKEVTDEDVSGDVAKQKAHLRRELADVYSWMSAIVIQLDYLKNQTKNLGAYTADGQRQSDSADNILLSEIINHRFVNEDGEFECPGCKETTCNPEKHSEDDPYLNAISE